MICRAGCGACCIALSISSPIPGMPDGKPAGARCVQLAPDNLCRIFGSPDRPEVCNRLRPSREMCGETSEHALAYLEALERATAPEPERTPGAPGGTYPAGLLPVFPPNS
jgi:Fe-S-cluster containining protein